MWWFSSYLWWMIEMLLYLKSMIFSLMLRREGQIFMRVWFISKCYIPKKKKKKEEKREKQCRRKDTKFRIGWVIFFFFFFSDQELIMESSRVLGSGWNHDWKDLKWTYYSHQSYEHHQITGFILYKQICFEILSVSSTNLFKTSTNPIWSTSRKK